MDAEPRKLPDGGSVACPEYARNVCASMLQRARIRINVIAGSVRREH